MLHRHVMESGCRHCVTRGLAAECCCDGEQGWALRVDSLVGWMGRAMGDGHRA